MPRRRYYRRVYRVAAPKKKWASDIGQGILTINEQEQTGSLTNYVTVTSNKVCGNSESGVFPTPVVLKVGNFKVQIDGHVEGAMDSMRNVVLYLMFIPEGVDPTTVYTTNLGAKQSIADKHPEWIMGWKRIDVNTSTSSAQTTNLVSMSPTSFSSRLKRNLNSGDSIYFVMVSSKDVATAGSSSSYTVSVHWTAQFWTCSN